MEMYRTNLPQMATEEIILTIKKTQIDKNLITNKAISQIMQKTVQEQEIKNLQTKIEIKEKMLLQSMKQCTRHSKKMP